MYHSLYLSVCVALLVFATAAVAQDAAGLKKAVTFYASFDEHARGDFGGGDLTLSTRFNHPTEKDSFLFKKGFDEDIFRIARNGIHGGALAPAGVLPDNGRVFFPAKGNIAYNPTGWDGALSMWINTDPNKLIKTKFSDPVQITQRGANNGGIWFDFNDARPRDMRMGMFPAARPGQKTIAEADPDAPLVPIKAVNFKEGEWHHVVLSWKNFDTGRKDAHAELFVDGKRIGALSDRELAMNWEIEKTGIYVAVNFIGMLDEFALYNRSLTPAEVELLQREPGLLTGLKAK